MFKVFPQWDEKLTSDFLQGIMLAQHALPDHTLFSDAALRELLEQHPASLKMVYAMPKKEKSEATFREGDLANHSGDDIMAAVAKGELWVQLLKLNKAQPAFKALEQQIIAEMKQHIPGFRAWQCKLSLLISSPGINVSYHADIPRNALWQIRGSKKVYIYPTREPYISATALESIYLGEQQETLPYSPSFDDGATVVDLQPGMLATWPVNGPHRIENQDEPSVSLVMEYFQPHAWIRYGVMYTNGIFRRRFGIPLSSTSHRGPVAWAKCMLGMGFKVLKLQKKHKRERLLSFEIDPTSPTGFVEIQERLREF